MSEPAKWTKEWWTEERMEQLNYYEDPSAATDPDVRELLIKGNAILLDEKVTHERALADWRALMMSQHGVPSALEWEQWKAERKAAKQSA